MALRSEGRLLVGRERIVLLEAVAKYGSIIQHRRRSKMFLEVLNHLVSGFSMAVVDQHELIRAGLDAQSCAHPFDCVFQKKREDRRP